MTWLMLVVLATGTVYGPLFHTQAACWKAAMRVEALDPDVRDTQCVPWRDQAPANIG